MDYFNSPERNNIQPGIGTIVGYAYPKNNCRVGRVL